MRSTADPVPVRNAARLVPAYDRTSASPGDFVHEQWEGHTTLVVSDGTPPAPLRAVLLRESALSAAAWATGMTLLLILGTVLVGSPLPTGPRRAWAAASVGLLALGVVGAVWRAIYQTRVEMLTEARRERTTFEVHPDGRLTIDIRAGMAGRSYEVPPGGVHRVQVLRWARASAAAELAGLPILLLHRADGEPSLKLLAGRDVREVEAVAAALAAALGVPSPERTNPWRRPIEWFAGRFVISSTGLRTEPNLRRGSRRGKLHSSDCSGRGWTQSGPMEADCEWVRSWR